MKFVSGIHTFSFEDNRLTIDLQYYHRTSTGLLPETTVYLYPRVTDKNKVHEIIMSPFHPEDWANIWRLELKANDRPGLIKEITKVLRNEKISILILESLITNHNHESTISLIAKFDEYFNKKNLSIKFNLSQKQLNNYYQKIKATFDEFTGINNKNIEVKRFEPIKFLFDNSSIFLNNNNNENNFVENERLRYYFSNSYRGTSVKDKKVEIDNRLLEDLGLKKYSGNSKNIQGIVFSDTEDKFILVRFFPKDQLIINLEITYDVIPCGVINELSEKILSVDNNFNLISCYNRIRNDQNSAVSYLLIDVTSNPTLINSLIKQLNEIKTPLMVSEVKVLNYSLSLIEVAKVNGIELEKSEEQRSSEIEKVDILALQEELLKEKTFSLERLKMNKTQIEYHTDIQIKNTTIMLSILFILSIFIITILVIFVDWEKMDKVLSVIAFSVPVILSIYSMVKGVSFRLPANNEETRQRIRDQWTIRGKYELEGYNSLENKISSLNKEIQELEPKIKKIKSILLK